MPDSDPSAHALDVPGARLYYERRGTGPLPPMIGSPMDSTGFAGLASAAPATDTVVTWMTRAASASSSREDTSQDVTPGQQADDVHRLLSALGGGPRRCSAAAVARLSGSRWSPPTPARYDTLVAHEPPVVELLPDGAQVRAQFEDIYDTYRADGAEKAWQKFVAIPAWPVTGAGSGADPRWEPSRGDGPDARHQRDVFAKTCSSDRRTTGPDIGAEGGANRIVVAAGADVEGAAPEPYGRGARRRARHHRGRFPGDHVGFMMLPEQCGRVLHQVLSETLS